MSDPGEPMSKGTIVHSLIAAVRDVWGEDGIQGALARLAPDVAEATMGADFVPLKWYPTRYVVAWNSAIYDGPAAGDEATFCRCVVRSIDFGFGRVRRAFLRIATPQLVAERATALWQREHTHGTLALEPDLPAGLARVTLRGHPFVESAQGRAATAEVFRYVLSLSRAKDVRVTHGMEGDALVMGFRWEV